MAGHRRRERSGGEIAALIAGVAVVLALIAFAAVRLLQSSGTSQAVGGPTLRITPTTLTAQTSPALRSDTSSPPVKRIEPAHTKLARRAMRRLDRFVDDPPPGSSHSLPDSASVAALDLATDRSIEAGADRGMTAASVGKIQVLETLLLDRQLRHRTLTAAEVDELTDMIEHSDNDAADAAFRAVGVPHPELSRHDQDDLARLRVMRLGVRLGLSKPSTRQGAGILWGLTTTSAAQQVRLLENLVSDDSPLDPKARHFALGLMGDVEEDQTWGVTAAASDGTAIAMKDGWLPVGRDDQLWADNSVGIVKVGGHTVLLAVLTQHNDSDERGRDRVALLARATVGALTS